jgi:hypothetical protein
VIQKRATSAAIGTLAAPRLSVRAIPGHIQTPPARASSVRAGAAIRALPETRACMQKSKKRGNSAFRQFRQRDKTRVGQRHWLIRQSFHQGRVANRGARLVDGQMSFGV